MSTHPQFQFLPATSMAADITSNPIEVNLFFSQIIQVDYTTSGTLGGTFSLLGSSDHRQDPEGNVSNAGNFVTITGSSSAITGAGSGVWSIPAAAYSYVKVLYTHAGGDSGSLTGFSTLKGV